MDETKEKEEYPNSMADIRRFFAPVEMSEFMEFWKSLTDEDKKEFRTAKLT